LVVSKAAVVNELSKFTREFPDKSVIPEVATTVTVLEAGSLLTFNVTARLSADTLIPGNKLLPLASKLTVPLLMVLGFNDLEKVSTTVVSPMPVAPLAGVTITTVGAVASVPAPVVNELWNETLLLPDKSSTPFTATLITLFPGSGDNGVNVTIFPVASNA
jgi:hypothetical protein